MQVNSKTDDIAYTKLILLFSVASLICELPLKTLVLSLFRTGSQFLRFNCVSKDELDQGHSAAN